MPLDCSPPCFDNTPLSCEYSPIVLNPSVLKIVYISVDTSFGINFFFLSSLFLNSIYEYEINEFRFSLVLSRMYFFLF